MPRASELKAMDVAAKEISERKTARAGKLSLVPDEKISLNEIRRISLPLYGMTTWGDMFNVRQQLALTTVCRLVSDLADRRQPRRHT